MRRRITGALIGIVGCLAFAVPAHAADNGSAGATTTLVKATATTVVAGPATTNPPQDNSDDDDSDKTGLWGLLGLLGLAGLAGLKRKRDDHPTTSTTRPVTGTAPPRADGATGSR